MLRVKVCGLTREEDVRAAVEAGADAVGFIVGFPSSPRNLSLEAAGRMMQGVPPFVETVLVTTTGVVSEDTEAVRRARPQTIQLYTNGGAPEGLRASMGVRLIRPYLVESSDVGAAVGASRGFDALLTDTYLPGRQGGTGVPSNWVLCSEIRAAIEPVPMILSGGLNPENVASAVGIVRPYAVDVSSGVELSPGVKDPGKISDFIRAARSGDNDER